MLTVPDSSVAVVIWSSDNRKDVLERVLPLLIKNWPDCPYRIYVGLNSNCRIAPNVTTLVAPPSEWRIECLVQLRQVSETYLIMVLDDFLFREPVNQTTISSIVAKAKGLNLPYLRLVPLGKSLLRRLLDLLRSRSPASFELMKDNAPFYSSMEIAFWSKAHFASLLELPGSIWDFEHQKQTGVAHYVVTCSAPIIYTHLVEKGRWLPYASALLRKAGQSSGLGTRGVCDIWVGAKLWLAKARAFFFG